MHEHHEGDEQPPIQHRSEEIYDRNDAAVRLERTRDRFGGIDIPATLVGALVAVATTALLGAIAGAALGTTIFGDAELSSSDVIPVAVVGGLALALAYFFGGWAAGRVARYNGRGNGVVAALWTIALGVVGGAAATRMGDRYDILSGIGLPNWLANDEAVVGGVVSAIAAVVLMVLFAALGGRRGETYHRRADAHLAEPHYHGA